MLAFTKLYFGSEGLPGLTEKLYSCGQWLLVVCIALAAIRYMVKMIFYLTHQLCHGYRLDCNRWLYMSNQIAIQQYDILYIRLRLISLCALSFNGTKQMSSPCSHLLNFLSLCPIVTLLTAKNWILICVQLSITSSGCRYRADAQYWDC